MIPALFLDASARRLLQNMERIESCLAKLSDDQIWARGHPTENSVGNLCLHLTGNVRQWILANIGGEPDRRDRDAEFNARGGAALAELKSNLRQTVDRAAQVIRAVPESHLEREITVQRYTVTTLEAIYHVVEHFSGHTGQIIFATKALLGEDLGFYRHLTGQAQQQEHALKTP